MSQHWLGTDHLSGEIVSYLRLTNEELRLTGNEAIVNQKSAIVNQQVQSRSSVWLEHYTDNVGVSSSNLLGTTDIF